MPTQTENSSKDWDMINDQTQEVVTKSEAKQYTSSLLVMVFIIVLIGVIVYWISESAYLQTTTNKYVILVLLTLFTLSKAIVMPCYNVWYPLALIVALSIGAWLVTRNEHDTARTGTAFLAVVFVIDAVYNAYIFKTDKKASENQMYTYGIYGTIIISVVLALFLGYAAI